MPDAGEKRPFNSDFQRFCGVSAYICTAFSLIIECYLESRGGRANPFPVLFYGVLKTNDKIFQVCYFFRARH